MTVENRVDRGPYQRQNTGEALLNLLIKMNFLYMEGNCRLLSLKYREMLIFLVLVESRYMLDDPWRE